MNIVSFYKLLCSILDLYGVPNVPDASTTPLNQVHIALTNIGRENVNFEILGGGFSNLGCRYTAMIMLPLQKTKLVISGIVTLNDEIELKLELIAGEVTTLGKFNESAKSAFNFNNEKALMTFSGVPTIEVFDQLELINAQLVIVNPDWDFGDNIALAKAFHYLQ